MLHIIWWNIGPGYLFQWISDEGLLLRFVLGDLLAVFEF